MPRFPFTLGDVPCSLIPVPAAAHAGTGTCPGVRPGGRVLTTVGDCTLNFLFRSPDGTRYLGTAGHCVSPGPVSNDEVSPNGKGRVERVWPWGRGPVAEDSHGHRIGEFAYAVIKTPKDFAVIRLDPGVAASPEMCHFGAPRGVSTTDTDSAVVLHYYGNGVGIGDVAPARSDEEAARAAGIAFEVEADALAAVLDDARLATVVDLAVDGLAGPLARSPFAVARVVVGWFRAAASRHPGSLTAAVDAALADRWRPLSDDPASLCTDVRAFGLLAVRHALRDHRMTWTASRKCQGLIPTWTVDCHRSHGRTSTAQRGGSASPELVAVRMLRWNTV